MNCCVCVCACMCEGVSKCMCVCGYVCECISMCVCVHVYVYVRVRVSLSVNASPVCAWQSSSRPHSHPAPPSSRRPALRGPSGPAPTARLGIRGPVGEHARADVAGVVRPQRALSTRRRHACRAGMRAGGPRRRRTQRAHVCALRSAHSRRVNGTCALAWPATALHRRRPVSPRSAGGIAPLGRRAA